MIARALVIGLVCVASACASAPATRVSHMPGVMRVGAGPLLAVVGGASQLAGAREPVLLGLFLDAGSRDAEQPEVATLAAWLLADAIGKGARGRALPDGIEVLAPCPDGAEACVQRVARGLALRAPSAQAIARAERSLLALQRGSIARDPGRRAEQLAIEALWPDGDTAGFFPLGAPGDPSRAKQRAQPLRGFIARAFGPQRALLVLSGPVQPEQLAEHVHEAFARAPRAEASRQDRALPSAQDGVAVAVDSDAQLSVALHAASVALAASAAEALRAELLRAHDEVAAVTGSAMSVRGGALAVLRVALRVPTADTQVVTRIGEWLERTRVEGLGRALAQDAPHAPSAPLPAMRWLGLRYVAGSSSEAAQGSLESLHLGVGVLVRGGRGDRVALADPDAALRSAAGERLRAALQAGQALARPELQGELSASRAQVHIGNGSQILARSTHADGAAPEDALAVNESVAIAIAFAPGAAADPPSQHGRAALLATLMTTACAGRTPDALAAELAALGARLEPFVSASAFGMQLELAATHAREGIALAIECALAPSLERGHVTLARLRLRERLGRIERVQQEDAPQPHVLEGRAEVARQLALRAPDATDVIGTIAPWGSAETLPSVDETALRELMDEALRGPSARIGIAGAVDAELATGWAARRLTRLPRDSAAPRRPPPTAIKAKGPRGKTDKRAPRESGPAPSATAAAIALPPQAVEALVIWHVPLGAQPELVSAEAARAFAAGASLALESAGFHVAWLGGDCAGGFAWAAAVVRAPAAQLATLGSALPAIARALRPTDLLAAAERSQRASAGPSLAGRARQLALTADTATSPQARPGAAAALLEQLRDAPPLIVPAR